MKRCQLASTVILILFLAAPAAAQTAPGPDPTLPAPAPAPTPPSTEPAVEPPPAVPPGTGQPPPPPPPAESTKPGPAPSPGQVTSKWSTTLYGFAEFDLQHDSTQSFSDSPGNGLIVRSDSARLQYNNGRTQTTGRNSRLGVKVSAPEYHGMKASGNVEADFMGNQPPGISEASFVNNGAFRVRAAYAKLESDYVDMLAGQYYFVFGQQPFFFPISIAFFGLPNQAFGRTQQFRLSHIFLKKEAVSVELAASAQRPPQRDSEVPDFQGALKLSLNSWKGPHTLGSGYPSIDPLSLGVSGTTRHFRVNEFSGAPTTTHTANGWGISLDAMLPIIPAQGKNKGNALTATGSFVTGHGIADLMGGLTGGAVFPQLPTTPATTFTANIDNGIVTYDADGNLHTINWTSYVVGGQYYLPPNGEVSVGANYTHGKSDNITDGLSATALRTVMKQSQFFEALVLADLTPSVRVGAAWQRIWQTLGDDMKTKNNRLELSIYFFF